MLVAYKWVYYLFVGFMLVGLCHVFSIKLSVGSMIIGLLLRSKCNSCEIGWLDSFWLYVDGLFVVIIR